MSAARKAAPTTWLPASASGKRKEEHLHSLGWSLWWTCQGDDVVLMLIPPTGTAITVSGPSSAACLRDGYQSAQERMAEEGRRNA